MSVITRKCVQRMLTEVEVRVARRKSGGQCGWLGALRQLERGRSWCGIDGIDVMGVNERIYGQ